MAAATITGQAAPGEEPHRGGKEPATDRDTREITDQDTTTDRAREPASARRSTARQHGWIARLAGYCWRYPRNVILALGGTLVVSAVGIAIPLIQRNIVDSLTSTVSAAIWPLAVALLVAALANFGALYLRRYRAGQLSLDVQHDLRTEILGSLSRLDGTRQDELHTGQIVSRSISDITMVQSLLSMVPMLLGNVVLFAGSLIAMAVLSP